MTAGYWLPKEHADIASILGQCFANFQCVQEVGRCMRIIKWYWRNTVERYICRFQLDLRYTRSTSDMNIGRMLAQQRSYIWLGVTSLKLRIAFKMALAQYLDLIYLWLYQTLVDDIDLISNQYWADVRYMSDVVFHLTTSTTHWKDISPISEFDILAVFPKHWLTT